MFISQFRSHPLSADKNFNAKQQNNAKMFRDRTNEKGIKLSLSRLFFYVTLIPLINLSRNKFIRDLYIINSTSIHFMWKKILKQKNIVRTFRGKDKIIIFETIFFKIYKIHILRYINPSRSKFIQNRNVRIEQIKMKQNYRCRDYSFHKDVQYIRVTLRPCSTLRS